MGFASARRGAAAWLPRRFLGRRVGGHLYGRFCRIPSPPTRWTHRDSRSPEIGSGSFAANVCRSLNAPQRPSQPSQRDDLLFLFFAQDIAHVTERNLSASSMSRFSYLIGRFSVVHVWPVLGVPRGLLKLSLDGLAIECLFRSPLAQEWRGPTPSRVECIPSMEVCGPFRQSDRAADQRSQ